MGGGENGKKGGERDKRKRKGKKGCEEFFLLSVCSMCLG